MVDRNQILEYVKGLNVKSNCSARANCPACGGDNTFSVSRNGSNVQYYCFRASCQIKGKQNAEITLEFAKNHINYKEKLELRNGLLIKDLVGWTTDLKQYPKVVEYLHENNCIFAYEKSPGKFWYDKINERVCFVEYEGRNHFKLATGRSLNNEKPKWFKYIAPPGTYFTAASTNSETSVCFIAEDCASACSLSRVADCVALCGTSYNSTALVSFIKGEDIKICLDRDALKIAIKLKRDLEGIGKFKSVKILMLSDDAKYISETQIRKELDNGN